MFERYKEDARRTIFYARNEASELGWERIEADFVLLGVAHENPELCVKWLGANYAELRKTIARLYTSEKLVPTSMDLPFSTLAKRSLAYAGEEADRLAGGNVGIEHVFLGLLRVDGTASKLLKECGNQVESVRAAIARQH